MADDKLALVGAGKRHRWQAMRYARARPQMLISLLILVVPGAVLLALQLRPATAVLLAFDLAAVVLSWLFLNIMFALHDAHGFYDDFGEKHSGLEFPDTPQPDHWNFAYFAIVIGMTFQDSDVQITSRYLRRVVLLHSVFAFFSTCSSSRSRSISWPGRAVR